MKRILTLALTAFGLLSAAAQPLLVGHRGSNYGLENSVESFQNGVILGYKYLETDVKFTKDNILVCSHDDDTKRLGGTKTLAGSTLEELQSETLTQTRLGTTYTGRLCSMKEYLQICKEGGIGALIELKWTAGINSNDCSKIPLLIDQIDAEGMRDRCIILTSMKPCLEYIRTHYPDIELQFLARQTWPDSFDWCAKWKIDADIESTYCTADAVRKFHEQGLKVNVWTANDDAGYKKYANMGCDFITTDRLDSEKLPDISPAERPAGNYTDYPETTFNPAGSGNYPLGEPSLTEWPSEFEGLAVRRALRSSDGWYVFGKDASDAPALYFWKDGAAPKAFDTEDTEDLADIALTTDGVLLGSLRAPATNWKLYTWPSADDYAEEIGNLDDFYDFMDTEIGESMAVSGRFGDLLIYLTAPDEGGLCVIDFHGAHATATACHPFADAFGKAAAAEGSLMSAPGGRDAVSLRSGNDAVTYNITLDRLECPDAQPVIPAGAVAHRWLRYGHRLLLAAAFVSDSGMLTAGVFDGEGPDCEPVALSRSLCPVNDGYVTVDIRAPGLKNTTMRVFVEGVGVYTLDFDGEESGVGAASADVTDVPDVITDLNGRMIKSLDSAPAGIYIVGSKKVRH